MSVFVDSGVFYAIHDEDAGRHRVARAAFERLLTGECGAILSSDYVYDETVTLTRTRFGTAADAITAGNRILGRGSFPDAVDLEFVDRRDVDRVLAFDDDFDGIVDRLDPETAAGG